MFSWRALRWSLLGVMVLLGGTMAFYLVRTSVPQLDVGGVTVLGTDADLRIDKAHMVQNNKGRLEWEMWADTALVYRKKDETHLQTLKMRFYSREGKATDVTADRGVMGNQSRRVSLTGNVFIHTSDGVTMRTDALRYDPKEHRVATDSPIVLQGETFRLTGVGLTGDTQEGRYLLRDQVKAVIAAAEKGPETGKATPKPTPEGKTP